MVNHAADKLNNKYADIQGFFLDKNYFKEHQVHIEDQEKIDSDWLKYYDRKIFFLNNAFKTYKKVVRMNVISALFLVTGKSSGLVLL